MSRLFRPNNDRSILRNLITDREGWEKIAQKPFTEIKKTKLVDLNQQIDSFASKWAFKGLGALWNPQFIRDLINLKRNESNQSAGQKVFVQVWLHPMLLSLRVAKYCPAIGYGGGDMSIMAKAIDSLEDKLVINENLRNLEVIEDSFHMPDDIDGAEEIEEDNEENLSNILEDLIVTEEIGVTRRSALDTSVKSNVSSLERQEAFDLSLEEEPEEKPEEKVEPKIEPKTEKSSVDGFDIRSILCGFRHEVDENVKAEAEEKPKITIFGFHTPSSLPMERPNQQVIELPTPTPLHQIGKNFADILCRCVPIRTLDAKIDKIELLEVRNNVTHQRRPLGKLKIPTPLHRIHKIFADILNGCVSHLALNATVDKIEFLEVRENIAENDGFTEDLDPDYLKLLGQSFSSDSSEPPTLMSVVNIDTNEPPPAPIKNSENEDMDVSLPPDLFNTSANDSAPEMSIIRQAIEERRPAQEAAEAAWSASTPQGKLIRQNRRKFPPF